MKKQDGTAVPGALVVLAQGFEEVEAVMPVDLLRRAGFQVRVAGLGGLDIRGSHDLVIRADEVFDSGTSGCDVLVLPGGGPGSRELARSEGVRRSIHGCLDSGGLVAAICAAPALVLYPAGVLDGRRFTCYPGMEQGLDRARFVAAPWVRDGNIITSRGLGTAAAFSLAIIEAVLGREAALEIHRTTVQPGEMA